MPTIDSPEMLFYIISNVIVFLCTLSVLVAVLIDFIQFHYRSGIKKEKKSIVETGSMMGFFFLFYTCIRFGIGHISIHSFVIQIICICMGLFLLVTGSIVNIKGRFRLGKNWSNQIKIYTDHSFISHGVYSIVRHPLYASLIWMFFGASFVYGNYAAFLANAFIFVPFMYYRARQEEHVLSQEFKEYKSYQQHVGMFFPKLFSKHEKV